MDKEEERKARRKARRRNRREEKQAKKKAVKDAWRIAKWKKLNEMTGSERKEYTRQCHNRVEGLFNYFKKNLETIFHEANINKLKELSLAVQQLKNSRAKSKELLSPLWKKSGIHGLFVQDENVKDVFEEKFNSRFLWYSNTTAYVSGRKIPREEILCDICNLILDEEGDEWYYIGIELLIITHQERIRRH